MTETLKPCTPSDVAMKRDTDLVCTTCRWRGGHSPDCPRKEEPWPMIEENTRAPDDVAQIVDWLLKEADTQESCLAMGLPNFSPTIVKHDCALLRKLAAQIERGDWKDKDDG